MLAGKPDKPFSYVRNTVIPRPPGEFTLHELWQLLLKRRATFWTCFAIAVAVALAVSLVLPTRYEAVGRLTLDFDSNAFQDALASVSGGVDGNDVKLQTQIKVVESDSLAWDIIRRLRLDQKPETAHRLFILGPKQCFSGPGQSLDNVSPECRNVLLDEFHRRLRVQSLARTQIIEIRFRCKSRELAAQVVNAIAEVYTETSFQTKYQAALRASKWVSGQLTEAKNNAQRAEEKYIAYQKKTGIIGTDENHNVLIDRLNDINQQLANAEATRIVREARYRVSLNGDPEALVDSAPGSPLLVLHGQLSTLKNEYAQLEQKFGESYPKVQQVKAQLDDATSALNAEISRSRGKIKSEYEASLGSETQLRQEFEQQKQQVYNTNEAAIQVALLKRDVDASRELYEQLVKQLNEAGVLAGLRSTTVTIIDPATIPVLPVEPHAGLNLAFGMVLGTLIGIGLCLVQENIDTTILSPTDLAGAGALPALGIVPRYTEMKSLSKNGAVQARNGLPRVGTPRIAALERPEGVVADAYRSLRTALLLSNPGIPPKVILVTSALPREGKTTTSVNTAVVFAQKERRVLLVDGDLRRSDLYRYFDLPAKGGLSSALVGEDPSQFYVQHRDLPNLYILPAGVRPPKPPDLLDSEQMRDLITLWREQFDHIIIDAPPVIGLSDSVILASMTDSVVIVVRAHQSRRQEFCLVQEILASVNANVSGAVINDFQLNSSGPYGHTAKLYSGYFDEQTRSADRG